MQSGLITCNHLYCFNVNFPINLGLSNCFHSFTQDFYGNGNIIPDHHCNFDKTDPENIAAGIFLLDITQIGRELSGKSSGPVM